MLHFYTEDLFDCCFDILDAWITELNHFTGIGNDHVVVLLGSMRFFKLRDVLPELVFAHQITSQQQFDGVVQCGTGNAVILVLHLNVQGFDIEMSFVIVDFRKDGKTFRRFSVPVLLQISGKNIPNRTLQILLLHPSN